MYEFIGFWVRNLSNLSNYPHSLKEWILYILFISGAIYGFVKLFIFAKNLFNRAQSRKNKSKKILEDGKAYDKYTRLLWKYISNKLDAPHISLRLVAGKNYNKIPSDDCFAFPIWMEYFDGNLVGNSWIDETGIWLDRTPWGMISSIYVDKHGIFFFDNHGINHKGFTEYNRFRFVVKLPFKNIIRIDFDNIVGYEPIVYTKHHYSYQNLWDGDCFIKEHYGDSPFRLELNLKNKMKRYSKPIYIFKIIKQLF